MTMATTATVIRRLDASGIPLLAARLVLGGMFIYMGAHKAADPVEFLKLVRQYQMLPESPAVFLNGTAIVLPWLEVLCGVALILGTSVRGAAGLMAVMLCVFTPVIFLRAMEIRAQTGTPFFQIAFDCGCGSGEVIIWKKLLGNLGLAALALLALWSRSRRFCLALWFAGRRPDSLYCHWCGYAVQHPQMGLCGKCATPPPFPVAAPDAA